MNYPCTQCGACCRRAYLVPELKTKPNGHCVNLAEDNTCDIYETRPDICRNEVVAKKLGFDEDLYVSLGIQACNNWMKEDGMNESYLIQIGA